MVEYKTARDVRKIFGITSQTLWNWKNSGKIKFNQITSHKILYDISDLLKSPKVKRQNVIYARVSNTKQKDDLDRQIRILKEYMLKNGVRIDEVFLDIASGMNEERTQFNALLDSVVNNEIDCIYISYRDRLIRFGYKYFENLFKKFNTRIEVMNLTDEKDYQDELTEDLISIIHYFSMKMYSNRRKQLKELEQKLKSNEDNQTANPE